MSGNRVEISSEPVTIERREITLELERVEDGWQWVMFTHWHVGNTRFSALYPNLGAAETAWREGRISWCGELPLGTAESAGMARFPAQVAELSGCQRSRSSATAPKWKFVGGGV